MLPPVQISQSATVYPQARPSASSAHVAVPVPQVEELPAPSGLELNAAIAGRLNILLLTGTERTAEGFSILSDLLGKSLGISRKEGESQANFMRRLAEVLVALPPSRRAVMERQFAELFKGLALQTLIAALSNPAGAQASRVAMWLDSQHDPRRDPATNSVITSYQQNDTEGMPAPLPVRPAIPAPGQSAGTSPNTGAAPRVTGNIPSQSSNAPGVAPTIAGSSDEQLPALVALSDAQEHAKPQAPATGLTGGVSNDMAQVEKPVASAATASNASAPSPQAEPDGQTGLPMETATTARAAVATPDGADARALQTKLRDALLGADNQASHGAEPGAPDPVSTDRRAESAGRAAAEATEPDSTTEARRDTLFVLKGWQHMDTLPPLETPADADDALGKLLRAGLMAPRTSNEQSATETLMHAGEAGALDPAQARPDEPMSTTAEAQAEEETLAGSRFAGDADGRPDLAPPRAPAEFDITLPTTTPPAREGVAIPVINYLFAADEVVEDHASRHAEKDGHEDETSGDEDDQGGQDTDRNGSRDEPGDEAEPDEDEVRVAANEDEGPDAIAASHLSTQTAVSERANDLYWRMAGWA